MASSTFNVLPRYSCFSVDFQQLEQPIFVKMIPLDLMSNIALGIRQKIYRQVIQQSNGTIAEVQFLQYEVYIFDYIAGRLEEFRGPRFMSFFNFERGMDKAIAVNIKFGGKLDYNPYFNTYFTEVDFFIREPEGPFSYSTVKMMT